MKTLGKCAIITSLIFGLSASTPALADGIADAPLPALPGIPNDPTKHVFSVNTVTNMPGMTTYFQCTSTEKTGGKAIRVGIEVFANGIVQNDVSAWEGVMTLQPGQSHSISIKSTSSLIDTFDLGDIAIIKGSARIVANSNKLICVAFLLDPDNVSPHFITSVPVLMKTMQKGQ